MPRTVKKSKLRSKQIIQEFLLSTEPEDSINTLDQMYYLLMQCPDIELSPDVRAEFSYNHKCVVKLLKDINNIK